MACGVPLVTTDLPTVREYAGDCAVYFKSGDRDASTAALEALLRDSARRAGIGLRAHRRAVEHLSWQVIAGHYKRLYAQTLAAPRNF